MRRCPVCRVRFSVLESRWTSREGDTWRRNLDKEIEDNGMNWRPEEAAAQNRRARRRLVCDLCSTGSEKA